MADIKMSYIFIEKERHSSKSLRKIILDIIDTISEVRDEQIISLAEDDGLKVNYIIQKKKKDRYYFEVLSGMRVNKSIVALNLIDEAFLKSRMQKYFQCIKIYDGLSEEFCKKLYPKYAEFERKLRCLVLHILTEAYGCEWRDETVPRELLAELKEVAKGKLSLNATLENMNLTKLESYLFDKRNANYEYIFNEKLSPDKLEEMSKEDLCNIIKQMRPTSLWERHFQKYGSESEWKTKINEIHDTRNKVAHQKTISDTEYKFINKKLNLINKELDDAIKGIKEENLTNIGAVDILGNFALMLSNVFKNVIQNDEFHNSIIKINAGLKKIVESYVKINVDIAKPQIENSLIALSKSFADTKKLYEGVAVFKQMESHAKLLNDVKSIKGILPNNEVDNE